jgi:hypothetical protein
MKWGGGGLWYPKLSGIDSGRAIAQEVSRWLPTAAARVRARVWSCGICGGQSGTGAGFLRVLRFPLPTFIPPVAPQSPSSIIWGLYNRPEVAAVPSGYLHQSSTGQTIVHRRGTLVEGNTQEYNNTSTKHIPWGPIEKTSTPSHN